MTDTGSLRWSSRLIFLLSAMGCTMGLGNIWRFPYVSGENGGGAFIIVYLICLVVIALPGVISELLIGRVGRAGAARSIENVASLNNRSKGWSVVGHSMVGAAALVLFYYPVVGSWSIEYAAKGLAGELSKATATSGVDTFGRFMSSSTKVWLWYTLFYFASVIVVYRGLREGIETAIKWTMPIFFALLLLLLCYVGVTHGLTDGLVFMFRADFSALTAQSVLAACGQALFTTAVAQASMLAYASYLNEDVSLPRYGLIIGGADTLVALIAGVLIFSVVFAFGAEPDAGTGLAFITLPLAFSTMPFGDVAGTVFFMLLTLAAFTSTIPSVEVVARWMSDHCRISHASAAIVVGLVTWFVGTLIVLSLSSPEQNVVSRVAEGVLGRNLLEFFDHLASNIMIPLSALGLMVFVGWMLDKRFLADALPIRDSRVLEGLLLLLRVTAPIGILAIFVANLWPG